MKYLNTFMENMESIIKKYNFQCIDVSHDKLLLVSNEFALLFMVQYDQVYLDYIIKNNDRYDKIDIWNFCISKFDEIDRENASQFQSIEDSLAVTYKILASGLERHFNNILIGDRNWIEDYKNYELAGKPQKAENYLEVILNKYL